MSISIGPKGAAQALEHTNDATGRAVLEGRPVLLQGVLERRRVCISLRHVCEKSDGAGLGLGRLTLPHERGRPPHVLARARSLELPLLTMSAIEALYLFDEHK
jgi:hypothetical protein